MAYLQQQQYATAAQLFNKVMVNNTQLHDDLFQDDAEFYGALCNLAGNNINAAIATIEHIKASKNHLYHEAASRIGKLDLQILKIKGGR